jgi:hypothetical protein
VVAQLVQGPGYGLEEQGILVELPEIKELSFSSKCLDYRWGPNSFAFNCSTTGIA